MFLLERYVDGETRREMCVCKAMYSRLVRTIHVRTTAPMQLENRLPTPHLPPSAVTSTRTCQVNVRATRNERAKR